jgi:hypothetical protein
MPLKYKVLLTEYGSKEQAVLDHLQTLSITINQGKTLPQTVGDDLEKSDATKLCKDLTDKGGSTEMVPQCYKVVLTDYGTYDKPAVLNILGKYLTIDDPEPTPPLTVRDNLTELDATNLCTALTNKSATAEVVKQVHGYLESDLAKRAGDLISYKYLYEGTKNFVFVFFAADPTTKSSSGKIKSAIESAIETKLRGALAAYSELKSQLTEEKVMFQRGVEEAAVTLPVTRSDAIIELLYVAASMATVSYTHDENTEPKSKRKKIEDLLTPAQYALLNPHISADDHTLEGEMRGTTYSVKRAKRGVTIEVSWPPYKVTITIRW